MNTKKKIHLQKLAKYFISKGKILTEAEYRKERDVPIRPILVRRYLGNWARVIKLIQHNFPEVYEVIKEEQKPKVETKVKPEKVEEPEAEPKEVKPVIKKVPPKPTSGEQKED